MSTPDVLVLDSYARLSKAADTGLVEKISRQHADNAQVIARVHAELGEQLDDGLSAWRRNVRRPGWERLLTRIESGASSGVVVWHTDRLFRQPRDLEKLIELAERGYKIYAAHGSRDIADPDDRFILRVEVAHAARSSDDTARRTRRGKEARARAGKPSGSRRPFGWTLTGEPFEPEFSSIADAADRRIKGESLRSIALGWNETGLRTSTGAEWTVGSLSRVLRRPRNAGLQVHQGREIGPGDWPAALDEPTWRRLVDLLSSPDTAPAQPRRSGVLLGSGVFRCGVCDPPSPMDSGGTNGLGLPRYRCRKTQGYHVRTATQIDAHVLTEVARMLDESFQSPQPPVAQSEPIRLELEQVAADRLDAARRFGSGDWTGAMFDAADGELRRRQRDLTAQLDAIVDAFFAVSAVGSGREFLDLPMEQQRKIIDDRFVVTLLRAPRGRKALDAGTVRIERRS